MDTDDASSAYTLSGSEDDSDAVDEDTPTMDTCLIVAAADGDLQLVTRLLDLPETMINAQNSDGYSALGYAAPRGFYEIVNLLVERGANIDPTTTGGCTPLLSACREGNLQITRLLLSHGADASAVMTDDISVLYAAIDNDTDENIKLVIVELLVGAGADINTKCADGSTPLHTAVAFSNTTVVQFLLHHGADINTFDDTLMSPLMLADAEGFLEIATMIRVETQRRAM
jgi:ankyrin repeat protein